MIFTHWPIDGHRDHRAISMLAYDAWLAGGKKSAFYYYEVSDGEDTLMFPPTDFVDITATEARKRLACYAHASQSPDKFYALQSQVTRFRGLESGYRRRKPTSGTRKAGRGCCRKPPLCTGHTHYEPIREAGHGDRSLLRLQGRGIQHDQRRRGRNESFGGSIGGADFVALQERFDG